MPKPEVVTNRGDRTVAIAINEVLDTVFSHPHNAEHEIWIATAYFNPAGFGLLAEQLERVGNVRLLLGAEPQPQDAGPRPLTTGGPRGRRREALRRALEGHDRGIEQDRDLLGFQPQTDAAARRLIEWLRSGRVEVRRYEKGFLHGKAFLIPTQGEAVIAGSSNFTFAGLSRNDELNLGWYQPFVVNQVRDWFEPVWDESEPYDLAAFYEERFEPHNPYVVYMRMLYERYGHELEEEAAAEGQTGVHLTSFQRDGVWRAKRILSDHHGVVIADGVGLGKTYVGGAIVEEYAQQRRQRVLIIAPAALRDGPWRKFLDDHNLPATLVSYDEFAADPQVSTNGAGRVVLTQSIDRYALVVVDEGHAFRNPETQRAEALRKMLAGLPAKDLVLLTATPVNNSLFDLYNLLSLFIKNDAAFADRGILSLRKHFAEAAALDPNDLSPDRLFDVLDAVAVRRTRRFVKDFYAGEKVAGLTITFPKVQVEPPVGYNLDELLPGFFDRLEHALDCAWGPCDHESPIDAGPTLQLARYVPSRYLRSGTPDAYEFQLAGLLRSGLLKRFESSAHAFALTCARMAASHDSFLRLLDQRRVATGQALRDWTAVETDELDDMAVPPSVLDDSDDASLYDVPSLRADVERDRDLLLEFAVTARTITRRQDPKLAALVEQLAAVVGHARGDAISDADEGDKRKTIVFTYYADTVEWIEQHLNTVLAEDPRLAPFAGRMVTISGDASQDKTQVMWGFAPKSSEAPPGSDADRYDLLISTDVLAEGVNLQQARNIVNFDLPWNPMRLVQRHGRIDRIGSPHDRVFIRCFFPDRGLDRVLRLEERLERKLTQAAQTVGVEEAPLPGSSVKEIVFTETREEIERLRRQDPTLFERGGEHATAYSGEEYRQELRLALENPELARRIKTLPWGSGSGLAFAGAELGFVFCVRVGDNPSAIFRWVGLAELEAPRVVDDTLACLSHAHATTDIPRVLDEEAHQLAYTAWEVARNDIYSAWTEATDPRSLQPEVPKAMRDAANILTAVEPAGMSRQEADQVVAALLAPYPPRIQTVFRGIVRSDEPDRRKAERIAQEAARLGLEPSPPPEPLPVIAEDDIHLVCWQAVIPAEPLGVGAQLVGERADLLAPEQGVLG